jgi:hypothetical protein
VEPVTTEIVNYAPIQRGGPPSGGGLRDSLVYKEAISAVDFQGRNYGPAMPFNNADGSGRQINIHTDVDRVPLPTEGARDVLSTQQNVPATGGVSEATKTGLGGGSLFTTGGVNFGVEVCLDHGNHRLNNFLTGGAATPGDPKPQVLLIPSAGMAIDRGPVYTVPNGLVFNVDAGDGSAAGEVVDRTQYRCLFTAHATIHNAAGNCTAATHYGCEEHDHHGVANSATCDICNAELVASYTPFTCSAATHNFMNMAAPDCWSCKRPLTAWYACAAKHGRIGPGACTLPCVLPTVPAGWCYACNAWSPLGVCTTCPANVTPLGQCTHATHHVTANPCPLCNAVSVAHNRKRCSRHKQRSLANAACGFCGKAVAPVVAQAYVQNWTPYVPTTTNPVADPTRVFTEQTVTTTTEVTIQSVGVPVIDVSKGPGGPTPLAVPGGMPTTTVGNTRTWNSAASGIANTAVTSTRVEVTVVDPNGGDPKTTKTTTVTTRHDTTLTAGQAALFAGPGSVSVYPVKDIPEAETV